MSHRRRYEPEKLMEKFRAIRKSITAKQLFRSPKHQKTMEIWCAAHFSRAYARYVQRCAVWIDDVDVQTEVDFELEIDKTCHPFQITEVMEPGRRRSDEYRGCDTPAVRHDDIERGTQFGCEWVRDAIQLKVDKRYAGADRLNVLAYVNFAGRNQQYLQLRDTCANVATHFASVWVLNGNTMCCLQPNPKMPAWEGWMVIDESLANVDA